MFDVENTDLLQDIKLLLTIKKSPNKRLTMCDYCCNMCKAFSKNIKKKDERKKLADHWKTYYGLDIPIENMECDGCRCNSVDAHRIDALCPVRSCVQEKKLTDCSECDCYPCETFMSRKGLSNHEAEEISELGIDSYYTYLGAFDNKSRFDRKVK